MHGLVRSLGGDVHVESEEGVGTSFRVWLPAVAAVARERIVASEDVQPGVGVILLVDDEETILTLTTAYLGGLGYRVSHSTTDSPPKGCSTSRPVRSIWWLPSLIGRGWTAGAGPQRVPAEAVHAAQSGERCAVRAVDSSRPH